MLTLITGLPGNGKTLYALVYVKAWSERESRPVWYHGIKDLKLPWHQVPTSTEQINGTAVEVPEWWKVPTNSIVVIDEAQKCGFGVRQRGMVPEWGQLLETHRHMGIDIVLITQDPSLIDSHDRKLCELHFHVMRTFGMSRATIHEFRPVRENVLKSRRGSIEHKWAYPKKAYEYYKSAEAHTHKVRIPARVILLFCIPIFVVALGYIAWTRYLSPDRESLKKATESSSGTQTASAAPRGPLNALEYVKQFEPRVKGLAYTAPVYDEVTKPVRAPIPTACVSSATRCSCYSEQATKLDVPEDLCRSIVSGGFYVAWQNDKNNPQAQRQAPPPVQRAEPEQYADNFHGFDAGDIRGAPISDIRSRRNEVQDGEPRGRGYALPPVSQAKQ